MTEKRVKSCPVCQIPFQQGAQVLLCPRCGVMHHHACWQQQGGCRQPGCPSAPAAPGSGTPSAPESAAPLPSTPPAPEHVPVPEMSPAPITLSAESVPSVQAAPAVGDTETTAPPPLDPALERLLTTLRCQQGALAEAEQVLKTAKEVSPEHPAVLEVEGDIAAAKGMHTLAERLYRQAFQADRGNARLEEKFANALLKTHQHEYDALPDDSTWSDRVQREPVVSAILSVLLPGLGQFFNGDYLKGAILVLAWAILLIIAYYVPVWDAMQLVKTAHSTFFEALSRCLLHGGNLIITLLLLGVWLYGIIDAAMLAKQPDR